MATNQQCFETYQLYHALKLHFTTDYDYFKYHGKTRVTFDQYAKKQDRNFYCKIRNKHKKDCKDFFVSNMIADPTIWIGKLLDEQCDSRYHEYKKWTTAFDYTASEHLKNVLATVNSKGIFKKLMSANGLITFTSTSLSLLPVACLLIRANGFAKEQQIIEYQPTNFLEKTAKMMILKYLPFFDQYGHVDGKLYNLIVDHYNNL